MQATSSCGYCGGTYPLTHSYDYEGVCPADWNRSDYAATPDGAGEI